MINAHQTKRVGDRESTWKRIQNNSKDDPKSWKQNGVTDKYTEDKYEKMQEMFNKDLEKIKKSQYTVNNAINEIKNTLEATNSRITEAEDRISEVEDKNGRNKWIREEKRKTN